MSDKKVTMLLFFTPLCMCIAKFDIWSTLLIISQSWISLNIISYRLNADWLFEWHLGFDAYTVTQFTIIPCFMNLTWLYWYHCIGVQAAARKFEERSHERDSDSATRHAREEKKKLKRDEMAARHLQRERFKEVN